MKTAKPDVSRMATFDLDIFLKLYADLQIL